MISPTFHGVPRALELDAWWLAAGPPEPAGPPGARLGDAALDPTSRRMAVLLLVALADVLFWERQVGLSVAVFAVAIFVGAVAAGPRAPRLGPAAAVLALGLLPVVEFVQPLSLALLASALAVALALARGIARHVLAPAALRLLAALPFGGLVAALTALPHLAAAGSATGARRIVAAWAFPLGGTLVFATLLVDANPVLAQLLSLDLDLPRLTLRALFWIGITLLLVPLLAPPQAAPLALPGRLPSFGINAASTERALWMFNALIGVQTLMDLSIFAGGAALPDGMTFAEYAHRGAYPLLATALLAGAFALVANPFLAERRGLRPLMLLWLAQNVALCLSALLRLHLYVEAYGLTYLRIHAAIWMVLVAGGLVLTAWQTGAYRPMRWLLVRVVLLGSGTLYLCSFVNFAGVIGRYNLVRHLDIPYVCQLGPGAAAEIVSARRGQDPGAPWWYCDVAEPAIDGWRDWGFRKWRIRRYLAGANLEPRW